MVPWSMVPWGRVPYPGALLESIEILLRLFSSKNCSLNSKSYSAASCILSIDYLTRLSLPRVSLSFRTESLILFFYDESMASWLSGANLTFFLVLVSVVWYGLVAFFSREDALAIEGFWEWLLRYLIESLVLFSSFSSFREHSAFIFSSNSVSNRLTLSSSFMLTTD